MKGKRYIYNLFTLGLTFLILSTQAHARIKLVALPERGDTIIRLDNPGATLIEEERVLTLQKGLNNVDFSWKGVSIDADSIRLKVITYPSMVALLGVSYPPKEAALVWQIQSNGAFEITVRISYLLFNIDRLINYKCLVDKEETNINLKCFLVLRNFSGEDFKNVSVFLDNDEPFEQSIRQGETKRLLFFDKAKVPIEKRWYFDAGKQPWDPEKQGINVGIPVKYRIKNILESGLGDFALINGKVRVLQEDGKKSTIFLGEDVTRLIPVGENMEIYIGDSRDLVVTQRKMRDRRINIRRNKKNRVVLYDTDELIKATIENFKDKPAILTMIQHIPGQWHMEECDMVFKRKDAHTLEFDLGLPPHTKKELTMHYHRKNVR